MPSFPDIRDLTLKELEKDFLDLGEPRYRAKQVFDWLYKRGVSDFGRMKNLPAAFIDTLNKNYCSDDMGLEGRLRSREGAEKFVFKLEDGNLIETVVLYAGKRKTVCISTQVGCKFACPFCASGSHGFTRNLRPSEITEQVLFLKSNLRYDLTNYVFMGMGEPLDNYENLARSIIIMNSEEALGIGSRRFTVSTCGIAPGIDELKDLGLQVNLSISLHATNDSLRNILVPVNRRYSLEKLFRACERYIEAVGRFITLEYVLIKGINDSTKEALRLGDIAWRLHAKVNLIRCSSVAGSGYESPSEDRINLFTNTLKRKKIKVTLRKSKGSDIDAACGQLAGTFLT